MMTKHYFNFNNGEYGVVILISPKKDFDEINSVIEASRIPLPAYSNHHVNRGWIGRFSYQGKRFFYSLMERTNMAPLLDFVVGGGMSEEVLETRVNKLMQSFEFEELDSERESYEGLIGKIRNLY